jgi:hypothetical protein
MDGSNTELQTKKIHLKTENQSKEVRSKKRFINIFYAMHKVVNRLFINSTPTIG